MKRMRRRLKHTSSLLFVSCTISGGSVVKNFSMAKGGDMSSL